LDPIRILLVDDFEPWRQYVRSLLQTRAEFSVVAEVSDGLAAVQKAKELKPDLILLDIGLPSLDGMKAANCIRQAAPEARIIFVSNNSDTELRQAAVRSNAKGYVLKTNAAKELLPVIDAAMSDRTDRSDAE
jgi:DNA-binding NarL/FixJ family response regulator